MNCDTKKSTIQRLRRIEGQVRGLQKMVEEDRPCAEIINQVASVEQALSGVSKVLLTSHLQHCAQHDPNAIDEVVQLITRHWR
ncbi:metal-sensitive transcriptional regulator [Paludibaculum fermentans]|uniref:Metal-sensitive transcriptional regulator n=1 Tax=Paludibaculum fermentans TaxID=1473598 RepID=A0A7S7NK57_PALFE|nr:metal-sensitive transcriptional regulator [Paludibaculum fermentans]QOY85126.1 metal-sensitive transcriptional regulator [Paludibaculum fermentans]